MSAETLKITVLTAAQAARILATAYGRRVTEEQVREVVEAGDLARPDGTFSLIDYVAFLAAEVTNGHAD
jgi:phage tail tape-measure protein